MWRHRLVAVLLSVSAGPAIIAAVAATPGSVRGHVPQAVSRPAVSPIYGVAIPPAYRSWELVAPAEEAAPFDELRVVLANPIAIRAYRQKKARFPDGSTLVKLAWKRKQSPDFESATIPGDPTTVQIMVKDAKRYPASGGWGFGRFIGGVPVDRAQHESCFACHDARVRDRDYVFTRWAP